MSNKSVPIYELYGEAHSGNIVGTVHVEKISVRAHVHAWTILAHRHATLSQLFLFAAGSGTAGIDGRNYLFEAPALLWLPAGCVHSFRLDPHTEGMVATAGSDALGGLSALMPDMTDHIGEPQMVATPDERQFAVISDALEAISKESSVGDVASHSACLLHLSLALVALRRCVSPSPSTLPSAVQALVARYRAAVDRHFRTHRPIAAYAAELGVTADRLHHACTEVTGQPPTDILSDRIMIEARRALTYTAMGVAGIAYDLGFEDPAYFSRYFSRRAGVSPSAFRKAKPITTSPEA